MIRVMPPNKHGSEACVVYIDQCLLSRFLRGPNDAAWHEVCSLIEHATENGTIVCPRSLEHLVESSQLADAQALQLLNKIETLSRGWDLRLEPELVAQQIIERLRGIKPTYSTFLTKGVFRPIRDASQLLELRMLKSQVDRGAENRVSITNEINAATRDGRLLDAEILSVLISQISEKTAHQLSEAIKRSLQMGHIRIEADERIPGLKKWETVITYHLITDHRLTPSEATELLRLLKEEGPTISATLLVKIKMDALQFARRERIRASDQYDITHAACALPYADIFVTDGGKAAAIRELKLDAKFETTVFSTRASEISALAKKLQLIS